MRKLISWIVWWLVYVLLACPAVIGALNIADKVKNLIDPERSDD